MKKAFTKIIAMMMVFAMLSGASSAPVYADTNEYPDGLFELPEDFVMSELQEEIKESSIENRTSDGFSDLTPGVDYIDNEVIALAESRAEAEAIAAAYGGVLKRFTWGVACISLEDSVLSVEDALLAAEDPDLDVPAVSLNRLFPQEPVIKDAGDISEDSLSSIEAPAKTTWNDIFDPDGQFGFDDPYLDPNDPAGHYQWMHEMVGSYAAWGVTYGSPDVTVAVIDTGVYTDHTEFAKDKGKILDPVFLDMDDDKKGIHQHLQDQDNEGAPKEICGHGTHVAGIIAAAAGNHEGGAGIAPEVKILPVPVLLYDNPEAASYGSMSVEGIVAAINVVTGCNKKTGEKTGERLADIINMSLGGPMYESIVEAAVKRAYEAGITICTAMGNTFSNDFHYPACFSDYVIAVASVNENGYRSAFSAFGPWCDVAAPGSNIWSTKNDGNYTYMSGTSMATPVVSGVCALYMSAFGHTDPDEMKKIIRSCTTRTPSSDIGTGIVNSADLFGGTPPAPSISVHDLSNPDDPYGIASDGGKTELDIEIGKNDKVRLSHADNSTVSGMLIYTTDGKNPAVKNGEVTVGNRYEDEIAVADILGGAASRQKITIKAAALNSYGLMSKVTTLIFTADPELDTDEDDGHAKTVEIKNAPEKLVAGKSVTLKGAVTSPASQTDQGVKWSIAGFVPVNENSGKTEDATIDSKGVLKTKALMDGKLTVKCSSADSMASATVDITISPAALPVKTMTLSDTKVTVCFSGNPGTDGNYSLGNNKAEVYVKTLEDSQKTSYVEGDEVKGIALEWFSSNPSVATVAPGAKNGHAVISSAGKGTATVTCLAMDGSNLKKTINVTVLQDVERVLVTGQNYIEKGSRATFKADVTPSGANNKKVKWKVLNRYFEPISSGSGITFSETAGTVSVAKDADNGSYWIEAVAADGSGKTGGTIINVIDSKAAGAYITEDSEKPLDKDVNAPKIVTKKLSNNDITVDTVSNVNLYNRDISGTELTENVLSLSTVQTLLVKDGNKNKEAFNDRPTIMEWSSGNEKIATVSSYDGKTATVTAVPGAKGKTTITCSANDGSGKKASVTVNVVIPSETTAVYITDDGEPWAGSAAVNRIKYTKKTFSGTSLNTFTAVRLFNDPASAYGTTGADEYKVKGNLISKDKIIDGDVKPAWKTNNDKIVTCTDKGDGTAVIAAVPGAVGTATVTCSANDGSGKKATLSVTVVQPVKNIELGGQDYIMSGNSATFKASKIEPKNAKDKTLTWSIGKFSGGKIDGVAGLTVKNGKVTAGKDVPAGEYIIRASAADGSGSCKDRIFKVTVKKAGSVKIEDDPKGVPESDKERYKTVHKFERDKNDRLSSFRLYTQDIDVYKAGNTLDETKVILSGTALDKDGADLGEGVVWTTSDPAVAYIEKVADSETEIYVKGLKAGNATLTCTASDGSGKKTSVKVNVIVPMSSIALTTASSLDQIVAMGKSATLKPNLGNAYGKPTVTNVDWSYEVSTDNGKTWHDDTDPTYGQGKYATVSKGKLSIPNRKIKENYKVRIIATATDGTGVSGKFEIKVYPATKFITNDRNDRRTVWEIDYTEDQKKDKPDGPPYVIPVRTYYEYKTDEGTSFGEDRRKIEVKSSNNSIASAEYGTAVINGEKTGVLNVVPRKTGQVKITMTAIDGTNVKTTFTVKIK